MAFFTYLLHALAATQVVFASQCGSVKISSQSDADDLSSCSTVSGDINIDKNYSGNLDLSGITQVTGSVTCNNCSNLASLYAGNITTIGGDFQLIGAGSLTALKFPQLTTVLGTIEFNSLTSLESLGFTTGVTKAGGVHIENTKLTTLDGISLETVGKFKVRANNFLKSANINSLMNATDEIDFSDNYNGLEIRLPNLSSGTNMTFHSVKAISIPSLHKLSASFGFFNCQIESLSAPNLTSCGDLVLFNNTQLSNLSLPLLQQVDGRFEITMSDPLKAISLPALEEVTGAVIFHGDFDSLKLNKSLDVEGAFSVQSTGHIDEDCKEILINQRIFVAGMMTCSRETEPKTGTSNTASGGAPGTSTSSIAATSTSGIATMKDIDISVVGLIAAAFYALSPLL